MFAQTIISRRIWPWQTSYRFNFCTQSSLGDLSSLLHSYHIFSFLWILSRFLKFVGRLRCKSKRRTRIRAWNIGPGPRTLDLVHPSPLQYSTGAHGTHQVGPDSPSKRLSLLPEFYYLAFPHVSVFWLAGNLANNLLISLRLRDPYSITCLSSMKSVKHNAVGSTSCINKQDHSRRPNLSRDCRDRRHVTCHDLCHIWFWKITKLRNFPRNPVLEIRSHCFSQLISPNWAILQDCGVRIFEITSILQIFQVVWRHRIYIWSQIVTIWIFLQK